MTRRGNGMIAAAGVACGLLLALLWAGHSRRSQAPVSSASDELAPVPIRPPVAGRVEARRGVPFKGSVPRFTRDTDGKSTLRVTIAQTFEAEARDPRWASAMEQLLQARLNGALFSRLGLDRLTVLEIQCRTTTCRILTEYPRDWRDSLTVKLPEEYQRVVTYPSDVLALEDGPLAMTSTVVRIRDPAGQEDYERAAQIIRLPGNEHPTQYSEIMNRLQQASLENRRKNSRRQDP
jgi:hypothetical protein